MNLFDRGSGCGWMLSVGMLLLGLRGASATPLLQDDFDDGVIGSEWTAAGQIVEEGTVVIADGALREGDPESITSVDTFQFQSFRIRLSDVYDSRGTPDYTHYTMGYTGMLGAEYILVRTDNQGGNYIRLETFSKLPNGSTLVHVVGGGNDGDNGLFIGDRQYHNILVDVIWQSDRIEVWWDDLSNGPGYDAYDEETNTLFIPDEALPFVHVANGSSLDPWKLDYVQIGDVVVPEPAAAALGALGLGVLALRRRVGQ